jgi:DNA modification methylase
MRTADRVPSSWQKFKVQRGLHPTQKPVALMEYLIRTYTNAGELVLDNTMGSGTTGVACINTGRRFIGIEKDPEIFATAKARIEAVQPQLIPA